MARTWLKLGYLLVDEWLKSPLSGREIATV
jgi:hypothetical protein